MDYREAFGEIAIGPASNGGRSAGRPAGVPVRTVAAVARPSVPRAADEDDHSPPADIRRRRAAKLPAGLSNVAPPKWWERTRDAAKTIFRRHARRHRFSSNSRTRSSRCGWTSRGIRTPATRHPATGERRRGSTGRVRERGAVATRGRRGRRKEGPGRDDSNRRSADPPGAGGLRMCGRGA